MAKQLVSGNLNVFGNGGQFETDRSTWGFADSTYVVTRSSVQKTAGLYGALVAKPSTSDSQLIPWRFPGVTGKLYVIRAKVFVPSANEVGADASEITFEASLDNLLFGLTVLENTNKTVLEAKDAWQDVELAVETTGPPLSGTNYEGYLRCAGVLNVGGEIYVDQLEIYEYIEVPDPEPTCDVDIDEEDTIIVNESGPGANDGSIDVIATTGSGVLEYSKDGAAWQMAHLFAGLTRGIYLMRARRTDLLTCLHSYPFAVNRAAVTHDFEVIVTHESFSGLNDAAISVNVTGTGGPYTFSKDMGATFQAGNSYENLGPGTYYIVVKNAAGDSVVKVVVVNPGTIAVDKVYHSKNPITLQRSASAGWEAQENYRLYNEVRVEDQADSGNYNTKIRFDLYPNSAGQAIFYLQAAFRDVFTFTPPDHNQSSIIRLTDRIKRFKNYSGELIETEVETEDLVASSPNLAIYGGVGKFHFPSLDYFGQYLIANKKFLTWAPVDKYVDRQQEDYLNFYCYANFQSLKLQIKAYFDDATNETEVVQTLTGSKYSELYQIPAGPANSGALLINPAKNVTKYELSLLDQDDELISEVRTYHINLVRHPLTRYFMILNSLGAFEVFTFNGRAEEKTSYTREVVQRFLPHDYSSLDGEFAAAVVSQQQSKSFSSGYIKGKSAALWHEYMKEFLGTPILYDVTNGTRYPMVITAGEHDRMDQNYERFIRVEARDAYDDESFTPQVI